MVIHSCGAASSTLTAAAWKSATRRAMRGTSAGCATSGGSSVRASSHASTRPFRKVPSTRAPRPAVLSCAVV